MNIHQRNPSYKLTMVSVSFRGWRKTLFINLPVIDGKAVMSMLAIQAQLPHSVPNGATFSIG